MNAPETVTPAAEVTPRQQYLESLRAKERCLLAGVEIVRAGIAHLEDPREADQADLVFRAVLAKLGEEGVAA